MSLEVEETITVPTEQGEREIQLLLGDITKAPVEDKLNVIVISAFQSKFVYDEKRTLHAYVY